MDKKDLKILTELDKDARQSNQQIGRKVGLSKEVVKYRIDKLIEDKTIIRFHAVINYFKLGIMKFKLYLRLTNANKEKIEEIANYFFRHKKTEWVVTTTGRWDLIVGFLVKNANEFDDEIQIAMNKFSKSIIEKAVTTTLELSHQSREFLKDSESKKREIVYHTLKDPLAKVDDVDLEILKILVNNSRIPITQIASRLKTTARIAQYKIDSLEKKKIILAYKAQLDPPKVGRIFCKALLYLTNTTQKRLEEFILYTSSLKDAVWPQKVLGAWDFELDFELESYDRFQEILLELKEKFPDLIKNHEFCIVSKEYKLDFFPGAYREITI